MRKGFLFGNVLILGFAILFSAPGPGWSLTDSCDDLNLWSGWEFPEQSHLFNPDYASLSDSYYRSPQTSCRLTSASHPSEHRLTGLLKEVERERDFTVSVWALVDSFGQWSTYDPSVGGLWVQSPWGMPNSWRWTVRIVNGYFQFKLESAQPDLVIPTDVGAFLNTWYRYELSREGDVLKGAVYSEDGQLLASASVAMPQPPASLKEVVIYTYNQEGGYSYFDDLEVIPEIVTIDIKPGSEPNSINLSSRGVVPVAVLATEDFDAAKVVETSVVFAGAAPVRCTLEDVDEDGDLDLLCHFATEDLAELDQDSTEATLTGEAVDGTPIEGTDTVRIVPPKGKGK